ncbi:hypothetical protein REPUB_Repub05bG0201300 [Reevesia pubescens]
MSGPNEDNTQLSSRFFGDLLDSIIVDVASECHRIAKLGLDRNLEEEEEEELRLSAQARARVADPSNSGETNNKYVVDIFGQTHPSVANEIFECMNCGRSIAAGRFAPHLEKCMGKGRKARLKVTRSSTAAQNRYSRGSPVSTYSPYSNSTSTNQLSNGTTGVPEWGLTLDQSNFFSHSHLLEQEFFCNGWLFHFDFFHCCLEKGFDHQQVCSFD